MRADEPDTVAMTPALPGPEDLATTCLRWVALLQLCLLAFGNGLQWVVFGILVTQAKETFGITSRQVNLLTTSYEIVFALFGPFILIMYRRLGLRAGLRCASAFNAAGCLLRFVAVLWAPNFWCLLASQCCLGVTIIFTFPVAPMLSARWFADTERTLATSVGSLSNAFGIAFGQLLPPLIVTPDDYSSGRWMLLFMVPCVFAAIDGTLIAVCIPDGPPTPPSLSEAARRQQKRAALPAVNEETDIGGVSDDTSNAVVVGNPSLLLQLQELLMIRPFVALVIAIGLFYGGQWSVTALLAQLVQPMGISEATVGAMGFTQMFVGSLLALPFAAWIDKRRVYQAPLAGIFIACTLLYNVFTSVLLFQPPGMTTVAFGVYALLGVAQSLVLPLMLEYAVELTYPLDESLASLVLTWAANTLTVPLMFAVPAILGDSPTAGSSAVALFSLAIACFAGALLIVVPNGVLRRVGFERAQAAPLLADP